MIQLASVTLSDGLQMTDDLIRATLQRSSQLISGSTPSSAAPGGVMAPVDSAVVKLAVQKSAKLLGVWLASAFEQLVGCEPSEEDDANTILLEVWEEEDGEEENEGKQKKRIIIPQLEKEEWNNDANGGQWVSLNSTSFSRIDSSAVEHPKKDQTSNIIIKHIVQLDEGVSSERVYSNFLLAICETCRLAERSMANTLNQSIQSP